jgi:PEP-CTERM motif
LIDGLNLEPPPSPVRTALIEARNRTQFEGGEMKFKRFLSGVGAMVVFSAALAGPAKAVVSFDSLTGTVPANGGSEVGESFSIFGNFSHSAGQEFTAAATGYIDSLTLALYGGTSGTVTIYSDNGSNALGSVIETLSLSESPNSFAAGSYSSGVALQQGTKYWILAVAPPNTPTQTWYLYNVSQPNPLLDFEGGSDCCTEQVTSGTYTGPNSALDYGMIVTIADVAKTAVPEPATWTLLMAGFGMIGAALRRKTRAFASA